MGQELAQRLLPAHQAVVQSSNARTSVTLMAMWPVLVVLVVLVEEAMAALLWQVVWAAMVVLTTLGFSTLPRLHHVPRLRLAMVVLEVAWVLVMELLLELTSR